MIETFNISLFLNHCFSTVLSIISFWVLKSLGPPTPILRNKLKELSVTVQYSINIPMLESVGKYLLGVSVKETLRNFFQTLPGHFHTRKLYLTKPQVTSFSCNSSLWLMQRTLVMASVLKFIQPILNPLFCRSIHFFSFSFARKTLQKNLWVLLHDLCFSCRKIFEYFSMIRGL